MNTGGLDDDKLSLQIMLMITTQQANEQRPREEEQ
jgi:hypothetical protein